MSYVQHTQCTDLASYKPLKYKAQPAIEMLVLFGATLGWIAVLIPVVLGNPICALHALGLIAYGGIFGYCNWWLYYRLVCLTGDQCAIGLVLSIDTAATKSYPDSYDTDYSVSLLLPNTTLGVDQATAETSAPFGHLIAETSEVKARTDIAFTGEFEKPKDSDDSKRSAILHAEFEGAGVWIMFLASAAALILAAAAAIVCMVPVWGWIASVILEILALLAALFGHFAAANDSGDPTDVNPDLGNLHPAQGNGIGGADILYVQGTHVFDGGHEDESRGWNEIHPIKNAAIVGQWKGDWRTAVDTEHKTLQEHCEAMSGAIATAQDPLTKDQQTDPKNQWLWHPLIDGCQGSLDPPAAAIR
jgi:hypothetical protein